MRSGRARSLADEASGAMRAVGLLGYRGIARAAALRLGSFPQVRSVLLTGSLTRPGRPSPGHSDIDLVLSCKLHSLSDELDLNRRARAWLASAARLGPFFYNIDYLDERELPFVRAFGNAWAIRLDRWGRTLLGPDVLSGRARRPPEEIRFEHLTIALRRWVNTGCRLLDPTVRARRGARVRAATRLFTDLAELWLAPDETLAMTDLARRAAARRPTTALLAAADTHRPSEPNVEQVLLSASLDILDAFAEDIAPLCRLPFRTRGHVAAFAPPGELVALTHLLGSTFTSVTLLRRGPLAEEYVPVVVATDRASAETITQHARDQLQEIHASLPALARWSRRPVFVTPNIWAALAALAPAPFSGAAASSPLWSAGEGPPAPMCPASEAVASMLHARSVEGLVLLRSLDLRHGMSPEHRRRAIAGWMALLDAIETTGPDQVLDVSWTGRRQSLPDAEQRLARVRSFSERWRHALGRLLVERLE